MNLRTILKERDLSNIDLSNHSLGDCNLAGKNLQAANLSETHLGGATLRGADLRYANLRNANLGAADLTGADLRFSNMTGANLNGAILDGADFRQAVGVDLYARASLSKLIKPMRLEVTKEYEQAKNEGFHPISHWGRGYTIGGDTLSRSPSAWKAIKEELGEKIFGDKETFDQVRLVQHYKHYSQWAYMITRQGFERIASSLGIQIKSKSA
jgi:hypothetical protein